MNSLFDFGQAVIQIREAVDEIEVKGAKNAGLVAMIFQKCNEIIIELNKIVSEKKEEKDGENSDQVGDADGQIDS